MWLTLGFTILFIVMFIAACVLIQAKLTVNKALKKAEKLLQEENPDKNVLDVTINHLEIVGNDESKSMVIKLKEKKKQLA